jgi:hypothetical protein
MVLVLVLDVVVQGEYGHEYEHEDVVYAVVRIHDAMAEQQH